jgi:hypothetical protein
MEKMDGGMEGEYEGVDGGMEGDDGGMEKRYRRQEV